MTTLHFRHGLTVGLYFLLSLAMDWGSESGLLQAQDRAAERAGAQIPAPNKDELERKETRLTAIKSVVEEGNRPPNIVLILADDLGYADTGIYGSQTIPTPHIDNLAKSGIRFTDAYVTAGTCSPSRAGILSGRYQQRFGFEFNTAGAAITHRRNRGLDPTVILLSDVLKRAGYTTGMFGKWHLGTRDHYHPQSRGFDEFYGFLAGAHSYFEPREPQRYFATMMRGKRPLNEPEYLTDAIAREAVQFITRNQERPFFAYIPFNAVHTPIEASTKYLDRFQNESDREQRAYNAMTSALDDAVGSIMTALRQAEIERDTLVIFLNDNGGPIYTKVQDNGALRLGKLFLFEGGIRVPMIIQWPKVLAPGGVYNGIVSSLDVFPTVCAAAGVDLPPGLELDGFNLLPRLKTPSIPPPNRALYWSNGPNKAIRYHNWKMIQSGDHTWLFDLAEDIGETNNLAKDHPTVANRLEERLSNWLNKMKPPAWPSKPNRRIIKIDGVPYQLNI